MMLLLACAKKLVRFDLAIRSGDYNIRNTAKERYGCRGKTIGIIGCGKIGSMFAKKCVHGFDMKAVGMPSLRSSVEARLARDRVCRYDGRGVFRRADFVSSPCPRATKGIMRALST